MELGWAVGEAKALESSFPGQVRLQDVLGLPAPQAPRSPWAGTGEAGRVTTWAQGDRAIRATAPKGTAFPGRRTRDSFPRDKAKQQLVLLSTTEQGF